MKIGTQSSALVGLAAFLLTSCSDASNTTAQGLGATYDTRTLAGKVASVNGTQGLQIRFSAFIEQEADTSDEFLPAAADPVQFSPLDGASIGAPTLAVNLDTGGAPQNETAIAVDPTNPKRIVAAANDYVTRSWSCFVGGVPCSALGDGYSGTYFSNDGGQTWGSLSSDPAHLGTLIPGVERLTGGIYDAGGDPAVAFDSRGNVYYAGLGFDRAAPPNTVAVNRGTFDSAGNLVWGPPTFVDETTSHSIATDKEWIAADASPASPFRDRVYLTWTRFIFNPANGRYVQSPIFAAFSSDGGATFSDPQLISAPVLYSQGSRPTVAPDGTVYVFWDGSTRLATFDSTWFVKSTDGGATFSKPAKVADLVDIRPIADAAFRVNSYPAAAVAPNGDVYVAWSTNLADAGGLCLAGGTVGCHSAAVYARSTDGGATWSAPVPINPALDAQNRTPDGYTAETPVAPDTHRVDSLWPAIAITPTGRVYMSYYAADVVSPWHLCKTRSSTGLTCQVFAGWVNNARLDYFATRIDTGASQKLTTHPINTRYQFGGGFIGDYTGLAAGSDESFHALWTDTNARQTVDWYYGTNYAGSITTNQQDVVTASGSF